MSDYCLTIIQIGTAWRLTLVRQSVLVLMTLLMSIVTRVKNTRTRLKFTALGNSYSSVSLAVYRAVESKMSFGLNQSMQAF